jgi:hypothetical protein
VVASQRRYGWFCFVALVSLFPSATAFAAPAAPTGLTAIAGNTRVGLYWRAVPGATAYNIYRGSSSGGEHGKAIATGITATMYQDGGRINGTTYYYTVKAVDAPKVGAASAEAFTTPELKARGCVKAWTTYEAEDGTTNGTVLTWNGDRGTPESEASGRSCVELSAAGQYVTVTTDSIASNTILVRYDIPQSTAGKLGLYINGAKRMNLNLTSKFMYINNGLGPNPDGTPGDLSEFFDEARCVLPIPIAAGSTITLKLDATSSLPSCIIDLVDLEQAPPALSRPANSISLASFGAVPNSTQDSYPALISAIAAAQTEGKILWIPAGVWNISQIVDITGDVTIQGAGMWHTYFNFTTYHNSGFHMEGVPNCKFYDFSMSGQETDRVTGAEPAFGGAATSGGVIQNVWIDHFQDLFWMGAGETQYNDGFEIEGCRIRCTTADGVNMSVGTFGTMIENCEARGTGDDAFAVWPSNYNGSPQPSHDNTDVNCTAECIWRANGFAIYGGYGNLIEDCVATDIDTYNGINFSTDFPGFGFSGANTAIGATLTRCGGMFFSDNQQYGGIWLLTSLGPITGVTIDNIDIVDPVYAGIKIQNEYDGSADITFSSINITNAGSNGVWIYGVSSGSAVFDKVVNTNSASTGLLDQDSSFTITRGSGDSGW